MVVQLNVGDRASLTCSVIKGDLPLSITWRKDNRIIDATQHISIKQVDQFNSILVIDTLGPDHTGNYSCHVRNLAAEVEIAQSLLVNGKNPDTQTHSRTVHILHFPNKTRVYFVDLLNALSKLSLSLSVLNVCCLFIFELFSLFEISS